MATISSSETPVFIYQTVWHHIPEDCSRHTNSVTTSANNWYFIKILIVIGYKKTLEYKDSITGSIGKNAANNGDTFLAQVTNWSSEW